MNGEQKLFALFWVCCTIAIASVAGAIAWANVRAIEEFTRNGYSETTVPGRQGVVWVKSRQPEELVPPPAPWPQTETVIHVPPAPVEGESVEVLP